MVDAIQQQEDEILVLQSIFGDDYVEFNPGKQFEVFIFFANRIVIQSKFH